MSQAQARMARVILECVQGITNKAVSEQTGMCHVTVGVWRRRSLADRLEGLCELPGSGVPRRISDEKVAEVIRLTLETKPENATH